MSEPLRDRAWAWWDRNHVRAGWILLGLLGGAVAGMSAGSWASCAGSSPGCSVHWDAVEAIGTWFGAIGGLLAVGAAIATIRSADLSRQEEQRRLLLTAAQRDAEEAAIAARVYMTAIISGTAGRDQNGRDVVDSLRIIVVNDDTNTTVHRCTVEIDGGINGTTVQGQDLGDLRPSTKKSGDFRMQARGLRNDSVPAAARLAKNEQPGWVEEIRA